MILTSRRQRRILAEIRYSLRRSDPRLVARFTMFTRLTRNEEIPQVERVRAAPLRWAAAVAAWFRAGRGHGRPGRNSRWPRQSLRQHLAALVFIPVTAAVLAGVVLAVGHGQPLPVCPARAGTHLQAGQGPGPRFWNGPACRPAGAARMPAGRR